MRLMGLNKVLSGLNVDVCDAVCLSALSVFVCWTLEARRAAGLRFSCCRVGEQVWVKRGHARRREGLTSPPFVSLSTAVSLDRADLHLND